MNTRFENNMVSQGLIQAVNGSRIQMEQTHFKGNSMTNPETHQSAVFVTNNSSVLLDQCSFYSNLGRCLHSFNNATVSIKNSTFKDNTIFDHKDKPVIYSEGPHNYVYLLQKTFIQGSRSMYFPLSIVEGTAHVGVSGTTLEINDSKFRVTNYWFIIAEANSSIIITSCVFEVNSYILLVESSNLRVNDTTFKGEAIPIIGEGIVIWSASHAVLNFTNCTFASIRVLSEAYRQVLISIRDSRIAYITNNWYILGDLRQSKIHIVKTNITDISRDTNFQEMLKASSASTVILEDCLIARNLRLGQIKVTENSSVLVYNSRFVNNSGSDTDEPDSISDSDGIFNIYKGRLYIKNSEFRNNTGAYRKPVIAERCMVELNANRFEENCDKETSGLMTTTLSSLRIINNVFVNNSCGGTTIWIKSESIMEYKNYLWVENSSFIGNIALGSFISANYLGEMVIQNSTFMGGMIFLVVATDVIKIRISDSRFRVTGPTKEAHLKISPSSESSPPTTLLTHELNITADDEINRVHEFHGWLYPVTSGSLLERETVFASGEWFCRITTQ